MSLEVKNNQLSQKLLNEGEKIFGEVLFFTRMCLENQPSCIDFQSVVNFIIAYVNFMDFTGLMFSKQFVNTTNMRDPRVHSAIQKRIMMIIKQEHLNLKNSLNLLKAFSLDDFDQKTLFLLENEIINKINLINHTNISVLLKKYYYKAKFNPTRFTSGISQNAYKYLPQINDQTYWVFLFLSKFKPEVLSTLNLQQIQFEKDALQNEILLRFIQIFANYDLEKLAQRQIEVPQILKNFNREYSREINEEIRDVNLDVNNRSEILFEKLQFYLIKAPQQTSVDLDIVNYMKNKFISTDKFTPPQKQINLFLYLQLFYYFKRSLKQNKKALITPQNASLAINTLMIQYQKKANLSLKELIQGCYYINEMNKRNEKQLHFNIQTFEEIFDFISNENREQMLSQTPCLASILRMYLLVESFLQENSSDLQKEEIDKLVQSLKNSFIYYKLKRNESKEIITQWLYLFARNSCSEQPTSNLILPLTSVFSTQDQQVLDKLEQIFIKNIENLNKNKVLEIFNTYIGTELCSFQVLEQLDGFLKESENQQKTLENRLESSSELKNKFERISLPFQNKYTKKYQV